MRRFGLIGHPLGHTFSPPYFADKFRKEGITDAVYEAYDIPEIENLMEIITEDLVGLNITIPYKESVMAYVDRLSPAAKEIGAVNTIHRVNGELIGYNTDYHGFKESLLAMVKNSLPSKALVLGTGGSSKAVCFALNDLNVKYTQVSRNHPFLTYEELDRKIMQDHLLVINTTPLGMYPNVDTFPAIQYDNISSKHFFYDLVYNPEKTVFLRKAEKKNAAVKNGYDMLILQAEKSWQIWNQ